MHELRKRRTIMLALALVATATACVRSYNGVACPALAVLGPQLVYPIPGVTGVPTASGMLVFAGDLAASEKTELVPNTSASPIVLGAFASAPSPIPSPAASFPATAMLYGVAYPSLAPNTIYSIQFANVSTATCAIAVASSGSFTTAK